MKKLYKHTILLLIITWSTNLFATDYMINGAGSSEVNGTYVPDGTNDHGNPRWKLSGGAYYLHSDGYQWVINDYPNYAFGGFYRNTTTSDPSTPPSSGWEIDYSGILPAPTIGLPGPGINYSLATFTESAANDGSVDISQPIIITHNNFGGNTFTGSNGDNFVTQGKVVVTNLSPGLTAVVARTSDTTLSLIITGNANSHTDADDVLNLTFAFQDTAFSSGDAASEGSATKNDLEINYFQEYDIGIGGDYTSIAAALTAFSSINSKGNILNLAAQTFTEKNLNISNLTIRGQGAESTIVQAAATQGIATGGVFITSNTVLLENVTVRNGKATLGGGINNKGFLTINNCSITNNDASIGGGIFNQNPDIAISLIINNSTISNNVSTSQYGSGIILYNGDATCAMTNCTVFGNTSTTSGNEGALVGWATKNIFTLINSTISGNDAGLLSRSGGKFVVQNSIISGNNSKDYRMLFSGSVTDNGYNIVENQTTSKFNNPTSILYSHDYLGNVEGASGLGWNKNDVSIAGSLNLSSTLADNSSINGTKTIALSVGSFAIDAGISIGATTTDQRGLNRNGATDIGAYEYDGLSSTTFGTFTDITKQYFTGTHTIVPPTTNNTSPIIYTSDNLAVATVSGSVITFTGIGTANITATQAADANYEGNAISTLLTVLGKDLVSKYGGISSTDVYYISANGNIGGAFGLNKYGKQEYVLGDIITAGLVMHLDAGNTTSYPGTGTVWSDISGNGNHGMLKNGVTFNSANYGSLVFDGVNDYFVTNNNLDISNTDKLTIQIILKTASSNLEMVMEHSVNWNSNNSFGVLTQNNKIQFTDHNQGYNVSNSTSSINDNNWHLITATTDRSLNASDQNLIYIDGNTVNKVNVINLTNDNSGNFTNHKLYISARAGSTNFFNGTIAQVLIYDKVLTAEQIQQNYNAIKLRYGL